VLHLVVVSPKRKRKRKEKKRNINNDLAILPSHDTECPLTISSSSSFSTFFTLLFFFSRFPFPHIGGYLVIFTFSFS